MNSLTNKRRGAARSLHGQWPMVVMLLPFFLLFTLLTVVPIISSLVLSFTSYDMLNPVRFVGIDNFLRMFTSDNVFPIVLKNTLLFALITGPLGFLLAFLLAWFVNEFPPKVRTLLSFMFYSPSLVGNAYFIWKVLFSGDSYGYLNSFLLSMGLITEPVVWLKNPDFILPIIILVQLWQSMGISFLANIAGLQNINRELYEAGTIDGVRNRWQELWYITLGHFLCIKRLCNHRTDFAYIKIYDFTVSFNNLIHDISSGSKFKSKIIIAQDIVRCKR